MLNPTPSKVRPLILTISLSIQDCRKTSFHFQLLRKEQRSQEKRVLALVQALRIVPPLPFALLCFSILESSFQIPWYHTEIEPTPLIYHLKKGIKLLLLYICNHMHRVIKIDDLHLSSAHQMALRKASHPYQQYRH